MFYRLLRRLQQWKHFNWNKDISMTIDNHGLEANADDVIENMLDGKKCCLILHAHSKEHVIVSV